VTELEDLLTEAAALGARYRAQVDDRAVFPRPAAVADLRRALGTLPEGSTPAATVIGELADAVEPALVGTTGSRYFGFVTGGALEAATAADILTACWDQLAFNATSSPAAAVVEEVAGTWLKEVLGLPASASFGFVTGAQAANTVGLAAGRHRVLADAGWDVEQEGLCGGPPVRVVAVGERHATIDRALRMLGLGAGALESVATDGQGAVDVADLRRVLTHGSIRPTIVCLQAGNVNTGAFDDFAPAVAAAREVGAWVHVDGAFGLWAGASPTTRHLVAGVDTADSWATDGHKWLNVPYDSGYAFCAHPAVHAAALSYTAAYLGEPNQAVRSPGDYVLESSRRARGFTTWAALRQLGRAGVADLVDGCCSRARRFAEQLGAVDGVTVANLVVLNQVLVRFDDDDETTDRVIDAVQQAGVCWMGATTWRHQRHMRISVSSWRTTDDDVDRSVAAIVSAAASVSPR